MFHAPAPLIFGILSLIFPVIIIWRLWRVPKAKQQLTAYMQLAANFLAGIMLFFISTWAFSSYYLRWVFLAAIVILAILAIKKIHKLPVRKNKNLGFYLRALSIAFSLFIIGAYFHGSINRGKSISLTFPFKNGEYYIMQGGGNKILNPFHGNYSWERYGYALDIGKLNSWGGRAKGFWPKDLNKYEIYGDTIVCPCTGKVLLTVNGVNDNPPGWLNRRQVHGNHIVIECNEGFRVFMAHILKNSFKIEQGDNVTAGQPIALMGNAGFTVEPHLHIQAYYPYKEVDDLMAGKSLPLMFNGKFLSLNKIFIAGK